MSQSGLTLLVLAAVFLGSVLGQTCLDKIHSIQKQSGGGMMMGSYKPIVDPMSDTTVKGILTLAESTYGANSNDLLTYRRTGSVEANQQLVNGMNYCIGFYMTSTGCKNGANDDYCQTQKKLYCVVQAYKPFNGNPTITSLSCTPAA